MANTQHTTRTPQSRTRKGGKIAIWLIIALFIVAMLLYCIKLNFEIKLLEKLCTENELMYKELYEEYIKVYSERSYFEKAYDELYGYIYSKD